MLDGSTARLAEAFSAKAPLQDPPRNGKEKPAEGPEGRERARSEAEPWNAGIDIDDIEYEWMWYEIKK